MLKILYSTTISYSFCLLCLTACRTQCGSDKHDFLSNFQGFIQEVKTNKMKRNDKNWARLDNKYRIFIKECQPRYASQMTKDETYRFWQQSMGYMYARYGLDLLKKFKDTDDLIIKLRNSLAAQKIDIPIAMDSLCKEWPIFTGAAGSNLGFRIEKILERKVQDTLLPAWKEAK